MEKCPACHHDVRTPFFFQLDAWRHLTCTRCTARLERKPLRSFLLAPLMPLLFALARKGRGFEVFALLYCAMTLFLVVLESFHPKLRLRNTPRAQPTVRLNINRPSH
jgi:hypothetical protein